MVMKKGLRIVSARRLRIAKTVEENTRTHTTNHSRRRKGREGTSAHTRGGAGGARGARTVQRAR